MSPHLPRWFPLASLLLVLGCSVDYRPGPATGGGDGGGSAMVEGGFVKLGLSAEAAEVVRAVVYLRCGEGGDGPEGIGINGVPYIPGQRCEAFLTWLELDGRLFFPGVAAVAGLTIDMRHGADKISIEGDGRAVTYFETGATPADFTPPAPADPGSKSSALGSDPNVPNLPVTPGAGGFGVGTPGAPGQPPDPPTCSLFQPPLTPASDNKVRITYSEKRLQRVFYVELEQNLHGVALGLSTATDFKAEIQKQGKSLCEGFERGGGTHKGITAKEATVISRADPNDPGSAPTEVELTITLAGVLLRCDMICTHCGTEDPDVPPTELTSFDQLEPQVHATVSGGCPKEACYSTSLAKYAWCPGLCKCVQACLCTQPDPFSNGCNGWTDQWSYSLCQGPNPFKCF